MQFETLRACALVPVRPLVAGPVRAREAEPVQEAGEDGALDGDAVLEIGQEILDDRATPGLVPKPIEDQGSADPAAVDREPGARPKRRQHQRRLALPGARLQEI